MLIHPDHACLLVIDVQQKLLPAIHNGSQIEESIGQLIQVADHLSISTVYSEQYPKGLGGTTAKIQALLPENAPRLEKNSFSCVAEQAGKELMASTERRQVVICGTETHVCVLQTALELKQQDYEVFVVADAVGSRTEESRQLGLERMRQMGVQIVNREMVIFEWLQRAGTDQFRLISKAFLR